MMLPRVVIERRQEGFVRCLCPECIRLDALFPNEGFQLALFPYRPETGPLRRRK